MTYYVPRLVPPRAQDLPSFLTDELAAISRGIRNVYAVSAAQIASPSPAMLADLDAVYRLNTSPYTRYQSNGSSLVALGGGSAALSAKLNSLDTASTANTIPVVASASALDFRAIGVDATSSIPDRAAADSRFLRWFTSLPDSGVGANGDYGVLFADGYPGLVVLKTAGTWAILDATMTFAEMLAISSPVAGMRVEVSTIAMGGDIGTRYLNTIFRYDGTYWKPLAPLVLDALTAASANVAPATGTDTKLRNCAPPAGLFHPGSKILWDILSYNDALSSGDTGVLVVRDNGAAGTTLASGVNATTGKQRISVYGYCYTANRLAMGGSSVISGDETTSTVPDVEVGGDYGGSRTLDLVIVPTTGGTGKNWFIRWSNLIFYPHHTSAGFSAPSPPPAPSAPTMPMGSLTATGTARNGPGRYAGFKMTAGAGSVKVYNGPDATFPLVHEVTSPVVDTWYYATGVDTSDSDTWVKLQNAWSVLGGSGQTVQYAVEDFTGSMYGASTEAAEYTRLTAAYTGSTFYWKAKVGSPSGDGSGSSAANAINGSAALAAKIAAGTITDGDIVEFDYSNGACTIASEGADWPCTSAITSALSSGSAASGAGGILFGNSHAATSTATGIWFKFPTPGTVAIDWSGASATNRRAFAALRIRGERILVTGLKVTPPNWSYIVDPTTKATRIPGPPPSGETELASYENWGVILFGNGNHVFDTTVVGDKTWQRGGIGNFVAEEGVVGATSGLRGSIAYCTVSGVLLGIESRKDGASGYDLEVPTGMEIHHNTISNGGWGHSTWMDLSASTAGGQAAGHGNCIGFTGKFFGSLQIYENDCSGGYQDGIAGIATVPVIHDNYIHALNRVSTREEWYWTGSAWAVQTVSNTTEGNAIKTGLADKDKQSGTTWLGTDGVAATGTDSLGVAELRPIVVRNVINDVQGAGITSNDSNGGFICANEIVDPRYTGILVLGTTKTTANAKRGNWYIANNFVKKTVTGGSSWAIRIESATNYTNTAWLYNNILWAGASQNELHVGSGATATGVKNVLVRGAISGTYSTANDLTDATSKADAQLYVLSSSGVKTNAGLPVGNSLRTAGSVTPQTEARTFGSYLDLRGTAFHASTPCVGPCNAP